MSFEVAKNTDVEIECSTSLHQLAPGEDDCEGGSVEIDYEDDCGLSDTYVYCIEDVDNATTLYIPPSDNGYYLAGLILTDPGQQGRLMSSQHILANKKIAFGSLCVNITYTSKPVSIPIQYTRCAIE